MTEIVNIAPGVQQQLPTYRAPMSDEEFDAHEARSAGEQAVRIKLRVVPGQGEGHDGRLLAKNRQLTTLSAREYGERYGMNHETVLARLREMDWLIEHQQIRAPEAGKLSDVPDKEMLKRAREALRTAPKPSSPLIPWDPNEDRGFRSDVDAEQGDWDADDNSPPRLLRSPKPPTVDEVERALAMRLAEQTQSFLSRVAEDFLKPGTDARLAGNTTLVDIYAENLERMIDILSTTLTKLRPEANHHA